MCEGAHHGETIAEDEAVRPIYVVLVKVNCFAVILLWVSEEFALDVLAFCDLQDGFGTDAFMDMQRNWIDGEGFRLLFACLFQPWAVVVSECIGDGFRFLGGECLPLCFLEQFGEFVRVAIWIESEVRR